MEVDPHPWGSRKIIFQSCDSVDELILVIQFVIKHNIKGIVKISTLNSEYAQQFIYLNMGNIR